MKTTQLSLRTIGVALLLATLNYPRSTALAQGALTPPGAPEPTMKTLSQIEPRTPILSTPFSITNSGAYYFTSNFYNASQIAIYTSDVTVDLNGFTFGGINSGSTVGIYAGLSVSNVTIRNGTIRNWTGDAVYAQLAPGCVLENLTIVNNAGGIEVGDNTIVRNCILMNNGFGIDGGTAVRVENCTVRSNAAAGIHLGTAAVVLNCQSIENARDGIATGTASAVKNCTATGNTRYGIEVDSGSSLTDCSSRSNGVTGILANNSGDTVRSCSASANGGDGFYGPGGNIFEQCNSLGNKMNGFAGGPNTYRHCVSSYNSTNGFVGTVNVTVEDCSAVGNGGDGISVAQFSLIKNNYCYNNRAATAASGIHVTDGGCRLEGNSVIYNGRGIRIDGTHNIVFHNTASGNSVNYLIVPTNNVGTIVQSPTNNATISGSTGGAGLGTTDPWANFSY